MIAATGRSWTIGVIAGVVATLTLLHLVLAGTIFVAVPIGVLAGLGYRHIDRARAIKALRPRLATTVGELPELPRDPDFAPSSSSGMPVGATSADDGS
jgi:hypothetical protein